MADMEVRYRSLIRFLRYTVVGGSTFAFDLALLYVLTEFGGIPYTLSTPLAFLIAVSINYFISRKLVFAKTERTVPYGYAYFIGAALLGALLITGAVSLMTTILGMSYLLARVLVACIVGVGNYLFNLYVNFNVAGKH
jgi:putative flippase GtrA